MSMKPRRGRKVEVKTNWVDDLVTYFSPEAGMKRFQARAAMSMLGGYNAGKTNRRQTASWKTDTEDADAAILPGLEKARQRSRDLMQNTPLAGGALKTKNTNVIGTGLRLQADIDWKFLGMTEKQAEEWEAVAEREFALWSESMECDLERHQNFSQLQAMIYLNRLTNGDIFINLPYVKRPGSPYGLKIQVIEADRICNEKFKPDSAYLAGGIEKDANGAPLFYHVLKQHPGSARREKMEWVKLRAFGETTGRRNVLHIYPKERPGQSRGVPDLAPVIEAFKQLGDYTEAEIMAAVVSAMFTVFIKSESGQDLAPMQSADDGGNNSDPDFKLGPAAMLQLATDESIEFANPMRPNALFEPFVRAVLQQIGVALGLPYEVLTKHFTSSYSAARAALIEAWKYFMVDRKWFVDSFCQPVYEEFLTEAVAIGRIYAPGFLNGDPLIRKAYSRSLWVGPARGQIDELKEIKAAKERVALGISTREKETAELTGGNWESIHRQLAKENKMRIQDGLQPDPDAEAEPEQPDGEKPENVAEE